MGTEDKDFIANDRAVVAVDLAVAIGARAGLFGAEILPAGGLTIFDGPAVEAAAILIGPADAEGPDARALLIKGMMVAFDAGFRFEV